MPNLYGPSHVIQFAVNQTVQAAAIAAQAAQTLDAALEVLNDHLSEWDKKQVQNAMTMLAGTRYTLEIILDRQQ
jgi:hypothetical protein